MTDAKILILQTIFVDVDQSLAQSVLEAHNGDLLESRTYLEKYFTANEVAAATLQPRDILFQESTMVASAQINSLAAYYPDIDPSILESVRDVFGHDMEQAHAYLQEKGHVMHYHKAIREGNGQTRSSTEIDHAHYDQPSSSCADILPPYTPISEAILQETSETDSSLSILSNPPATASINVLDVPPPIPPRKLPDDISSEPAQLQHHLSHLDFYNMANVDEPNQSGQGFSSHIYAQEVSQPRQITPFSPRNTMDWPDSPW
ncbi:hypothetical protein BASA61_001040 [Batrachochytrium salamandrivorans]|nr:hypothetical protein BASA62_006739 [Batrachochytrium salamandrivorans]KAH6579859.1 hypothetical protein BASA60_003095 [Batrachochytrium salamandrivorans]KAH6602516.1 hypothetical protein BASA61_001040 [Batrachochytrium salamandrivorans]KAH9277040.1 hypothetical protein BASA83_000558 [Batrachochytrium salamandrivorans]